MLRFGLIRSTLTSAECRYNLPTPEAIFTLDFFRRQPEPFYELAREMWPGQYRPTRTHALFALLHKKGLLRRVYSQNIDTLEVRSLFWIASHMA